MFTSSCLHLTPLQGFPPSELFLGTVGSLKSLESGWILKGIDTQTSMFAQAKESVCHQNRMNKDRFDQSRGQGNVESSSSI